MAKASYYGVENIINAIDNVCQGDPQPPLYFAVWHSSKGKICQYNQGDYDKGIEYLRDNLEPLVETGYDTTIIIKLHPNPCKGFYQFTSEDISTLYCCVIPFEQKQLGYAPPSHGRAVSYPYVAGRPAPVNDGRMSYDQFLERQQMENLPQTITGIIKEELAALKLAEPPPPVAEPEDSMQSVMIGHLKNPVLVEKMLDFIANFIPMLQKPVQQAPVQVAGIRLKKEEDTVTGTAQPETVEQVQEALTPETEAEALAWQQKIDAALIRLSNFGDIAEDLTLLADFAEENTVMFKSLLTQMRDGKK